MLRILTIVTLGALVPNLGGTAFACCYNRPNTISGAVSGKCPAHTCSQGGDRTANDVKNCAASNCRVPGKCPAHTCAQSGGRMANDVKNCAASNCKNN
jgi:hypothetical protein